MPDRQPYSPQRRRRRNLDEPVRIRPANRLRAKKKASMSIEDVIKKVLNKNSHGLEIGDLVDEVARTLDAYNSVMTILTVLESMVHQDVVYVVNNFRSRLYFLRTAKQNEVTIIEED